MAARRANPQAIQRAREQTRAYLAGQPSSARRGLRALDAAIREAAPDAEAAFSYGIPGFRLEGKPLVWYAAWAEHWSMYPVTAAMQSAGGAQLGQYAAGKGTLRFPAAAALPLGFIKRLVQARAVEIRAAQQPRSRAPAKRSSVKRGGAANRRGVTKHADAGKREARSARTAAAPRRAT
jgi:uncharacterized protein YdhG (YjbR/CyaY superfamily)